MKKIYWVLIIFGVLLLAVIRFWTPEDTWIRNKKGEYVEHGKPPSLPSFVEEQQEAILKALDLYGEKKQEGMEFNSQCLGIVYGGEIGYAVDMVNVPRNDEDNKPENQCEAYRTGEVKNFIELDQEGNIFRIS